MFIIRRHTLVKNRSRLTRTIGPLDQVENAAEKVAGNWVKNRQKGGPKKLVKKIDRING